MFGCWVEELKIGLVIAELIYLTCGCAILDRTLFCPLPKVSHNIIIILLILVEGGILGICDDFYTIFPIVLSFCT